MLFIYRLASRDLGDFNPAALKYLTCSSGLSVEVVEPRCEGSSEDAEAGPPLVQVHRLRGHLLPVQALRDPRLCHSRVSVLSVALVDQTWNE